MNNLFRELMVNGLGALFLTRDKLKELMDDLVEQGKMNREEAENFIDEMMTGARKQREKLKEKIKSELQDSLQDEERIKELEEQVNKLELQVKALEKEVENKSDQQRIEVDDA
ncbi:phasin family protein [Halanaerobaculum tunisiense]